MAKNNAVVISSGLIPFSFADQDGTVLSSFKLNPSDVKLAVRCEEISKYFADRADSVGGGLADMAAYDEEITQKLLYLIGSGSKETLFVPPMTATTILPDGNIFAVVILEKIIEAVAPEIQKRAKKMQTAVSKHTAKYTK